MRGARKLPFDIHGSTRSGRILRHRRFADKLGLLVPLIAINTIIILYELALG